MLANIKKGEKMNLITGQAIASASIALAVSIAVYVTKDGSYLWGLSALVFVWR